MRQLLLLRHAKSSWDDPALSDHARPLNRRGQLSAAAMRRAIKGLGLAPDLVLVSSARRTLQTLERLEPWDRPPQVEPLDALYLASDAQLLSVLHQVQDTVNSVLVVAHNPGLHDLAVQLAGQDALMPDAVFGRRLQDGYPSGALAEFRITRPWPQLERGASLVRFLCPRDLPEFAV